MTEVVIDGFHSGIVQQRYDRSYVPYVGVGSPDAKLLVSTEGQRLLEEQSPLLGALGRVGIHMAQHGPLHSETSPQTLASLGLARYRHASRGEEGTIYTTTTDTPIIVKQYNNPGPAGQLSFYVMDYVHAALEKQPSNPGFVHPRHRLKAPAQYAMIATASGHIATFMEQLPEESYRLTSKTGDPEGMQMEFISVLSGMNTKTYFTVRLIGAIAGMYVLGDTANNIFINDLPRAENGPAIKEYWLIDQPYAVPLNNRILARCGMRVIQLLNTIRDGKLRHLIDKPLQARGESPQKTTA